MNLHYMIDVAAENGGLHVASADHVVWHQKELLVLHPIMLATDFGKFGDGPHGGVVLQQEMKHRHEVRLTSTETAVQIARFATHGIHGGLNKAEGGIKALDQLRRDDLLLQRLLRFGDTFGQVENEVSLAYPIRQIKQLADQFFRHGSVRRFHYASFVR